MYGFHPSTLVTSCHVVPLPCLYVPLNVHLFLLWAAEYGVDCGGSCAAACSETALTIKDDYSQSSVMDDGKMIEIRAGGGECPGRWSTSSSHIYQSANCYGTAWPGTTLNGNRRCTQQVGGTYYIMQRLGALGDFEAKLSLRSNDDDGFGIVWSYSDAEGDHNMYQIMLDNTNQCADMMRRQHGVTNYIAKTPKATKWRYPKSTFFKARLTYIQGHIKFEVMFTGTTYVKVFEHTDPNPLPAGNVGFASFASTGAYYRIDSLKLLSNTCDRNLPSASSSLKLHLTADSFAQSSAGTAVKQWNDVSGYSNHAWVGSDSQAPNVVKSKWTGRNAVRFTSTDTLQLWGASYLDPRASGMTLFLVVDPTSAGSLPEGPATKRMPRQTLLREDFSGISTNDRIGYYGSCSLKQTDASKARF